MGKHSLQVQRKTKVTCAIVCVIKKATKIFTLIASLSMSGYQDSNLGPPAPKAGALTGLRYTPKY
jgi:hypothetical protein